MCCVVMNRKEEDCKRLALFQFLFYSIVAVECWLEANHAQKYGTDAFNVAHFAWMDAIVDVSSLSKMIFASRVFCCLLSLFVASQNIYCNNQHYFSTLMKYCLACLYTMAYFSSQIDNYQHHFLVSLLLILNCFEWQKNYVWKVKTIVYQVAWVYFCTSLAKLHPLFINGASLKKTVGGPLAMWLYNYVRYDGVWSSMAIMTIFVELFLSFGLLRRALWPLCGLIGLSLHTTLEFGGFSIGLFSYMMIAFFLFLSTPLNIVSKIISILNEHNKVYVFGIVVIQSAIIYTIEFPFKDITMMCQTILVISICSTLFSNQSTTSTTCSKLISSLILLLLTTKYNPTFDFHFNRGLELTNQLKFDKGFYKKKTIFFFDILCFDIKSY